MTINTELRSMSETQLLEIVLQIVSKRNDVTGIDFVELMEVNAELARRDLIRLARQHHPTMEGAEK